MKKTLLFFIVAFATFLTPKVFAQTTITFESATVGVMTSNTYTESGYTFEDPVATNKLEIRGTSSSYPSKVIINKDFNSTIRLSKSDNGVFNLASFDYAGDPWGGLADATITGFLSGGTTVTSTISSNKRTLATRRLNWTNLTKVEINYTGGKNNSYGALDNIVVSSGATIDTQAPSVPTALTTSALTATSFTLAWTASTDNIGVTAYDVYKDGALYTSVTGTTANISGLTCATTYAMTVKAKDAAGNVSAASTSSNVTISTCPDISAPSVPSGLASSAITTTSFTLSWTASTDNIGVIAYDVYKDGALYTSVTTTTANISSLTSATSYTMTVKAKDAAGNVSAASTALNVTTSNAITTTTITFESATEGSLTSVSYSEIGYTLEDGALSESLYIRGTTDGYASKAIFNTNFNRIIRLRKTDNSLFDLQSLEYAGGVWGDLADATVTGYISGGTTVTSNTSSSSKTYTALTLNWTNLTKVEIDFSTGTNSGFGALDNFVVASGSGSSDSQAPSAPTSLISSAITQTSFTLSWTASTDNVAVTGYDVYKDGALYTSVTSTSANISGLTCAITYAMTVKAKDAAGNVSAVSTSSNVTTSTCPDISAPTVPSGLASSAITTTSFTLSWTASTDNVGVTAYDVFKNGVSIGTTTSTSMNVSGLTASTSYTMTVKAKDAADNVSNASTALAVTTSPNLGNGNSTEYGRVSNWGSTDCGVVNSAPPVNFFMGLWTKVKEPMGSGSKGNDYPMALRCSDGSMINCVSGNIGSQDGTSTNWLYNANTMTFDPNMIWRGDQASVLTQTTEAIARDWVYIGFHFQRVGAKTVTTLFVKFGVNGTMQQAAQTTENQTYTPTSLHFGTGLTSASNSYAMYFRLYGMNTLPTAAQIDAIAMGSATPDLTAWGDWPLIDGNPNDVSGNGRNFTITGSLYSGVAGPTIGGGTADTQAPSTPTGLSSSNITSDSVTLSWTASTDNVGVTGYDVYANGALTTSVTGTTANIVGLVSSTTYAMTVKAKDAAGNVSAASSSLNVTTSAATPTARTNNIGMNAGNPGIDYNADKVFADAMRSHRSCEKIISGDGSDDAPKDANYWPTTDAKFLVWAGLTTNNNSGTYKLSFNGSATVTANGQAVSNMVYNSSTNITTADLVISDIANSYLSISFSNTKRTSASATNTGVTNVKLMRPLTPGSTASYETASLFMDQYIQQLASFKCIRSLGWVAVNWNQDATWADRTLMQHARQSPPTGGKAYGWEGRGSSYESLILFANQAQKDVWLTIPHQVDDDYITKLAQLFKYGSDGVTPYTSTQANPVYPPLNSNLKLYVEYSNEIWNDQFSQTGWTYTKASTNTEVKFDGVTDQYELGMRYKGLRTVQISILFRNVFGSDMMTQVRPVVCTQKGYNSRTTQTMSFIDRYYAKRDYRSTWNDPHPVNYYIYGFGGSFYWYTDGSAVTTSTIWTNGSWNATASFNDSWGNPAGFYDQTAWDCGIAKQYGLAYLLYEGDMHPSYSNGDDVVVKQLHTGTWDSRMNQNTLDHLNVLNQVDAELFNFLQLNGTDGSTWAVRNAVNPSNSPQMDAINTFSAASTLPITLGSVAPFTRAGNAFDSRGSENRNLNGTGSTTLTAITGTWGTSLSSSYLFRVSSNGTYNVQVQYSTTAAATLAVEFAGNVVATYNLANTNGAAALTSFANITCSTDKLYSIRLVCTSGVVNIISMSVGINSSANRVGLKTKTPSDSISNSVVLYPNPATSAVTVEIANKFSEGTITIVDLMGKIIISKEAKESVTFDVSNFTSGVYLIQIVTDDKLRVERLIVR